VTLLVFILLGFLGWIVSKQITGLLTNLPAYKGEVIQKIEKLRGASESAVWVHMRDFFDTVTGQLIGNSATSGGTAGNIDELPLGASPDRPLYVTTANTGWSRVLEYAGPAGEVLASAFLVIVLTVFMLIQRESLRNRIVRLMGHARLIVTTRAIDEGARRISRYLIMLVFVNAIVALLLSVGLFLFGLYADPPDRPALRTTAVFWGFLAGSLRFVPYLGTWIAAGLLLIFVIATLPGWWLPLIVLAYFVVLELTAANVVEPLLFGHSTGSSPLALLLAAAFWTWLWGPVGLILSTPLTVILVVMGKYVPELYFFEVLLGDEPALSKDTTFYQRLVAHDVDEASDLVEQYAQEHSVEAVCAEVLLPTLIRARHDREHGQLDAEDFQFVCRATREILHDNISPPTPEEGDAAKAKTKVFGCPARDEADEVALEIFAAILKSVGQHVEVLSSSMLAAEILEKVSNQCPPVVCIASLPPGGLAQARYLCKRIRSECPRVKIAVGRWGEVENVEQVIMRLKSAGADFVGTTLAETKSQIVPLLQVAQVAAVVSGAPEVVAANGQ
jgi:predicted PurR-regulated permease PerM